MAGSRSAWLALGVLMLELGTAAAEDRVLRAELELEAPLSDVWAAWTTPEGVRSFFAPGCNVEPRPGGPYEILFAPDAPAGQRGGEGLTVLAAEPMRRFAFTWNAPPKWPEIRAQRTVVNLRLEGLGPSRTRLEFTHGGFGEGADWDAVYDYFDQAWRGVVLPRLVHRLANGPIDWSKPPKLDPVAPTLKRSLRPAPAE